MRDRFWERYPLEQFTTEEWEALCDGCARCCLQKLEDEESGQVYYTSLACHLLDLEQCRCSDYPRRNQRVPNCVPLTPEKTAAFHWLPATCGYRLIHEGETLPPWHPLISGSRESVHQAEISIRSFAMLESGEEDLEAYLLEGL
jgi:uncharacterized cysteine cluster protein YcgN (CxxCxxCC family)